MDYTPYYIEKGQGTPLILLHGNGDNCGYFVNQMDEFSKYFRVIALDTRGHGKSERGTAPFTLHQFSDDLAAFMTSLNIEKAHILGFSDGGNIATVFALEHPEMVDKLILNGSNINTWGTKMSFQLPTDIKYYIGSRKHPNDIKTELLRIMVKEPDMPRKNLAKITAKTLVLAGTKDIICKSHTKLIAKSIPNSTLKFIKGDHCIALHNPTDYNKTVLEFLND